MRVKTSGNQNGSARKSKKLLVHETVKSTVISNLRVFGGKDVCGPYFSSKLNADPKIIGARLSETRKA